MDEREPLLTSLGREFRGIRHLIFRPGERARNGLRSPLSRRLGSRPLDFALLQLLATALALGGVEIALLVAGPIGPVWVLILFPAVGWIYALAGTLAWQRRPSNRIGALMIVAGFLWLAAGLANTGVPALIAVGLILATAPLAVIGHMLLGFPSGRLRGARDRGVVVAGYVVALVLQVPLYLFASTPAPYDVVEAAPRPDLLTAGLWLQRACGLLVVVAIAAILAGRFRRATRSERRVLGPLALYGLVAVLFIPVSGSVLPAVAGLGPVTIVTLQLAVLGGIPFAFAVAVLRGGFARTAELDELGAWLGDPADGRPELAEALAWTLGDPSLELAFWARGGRYVDALGTEIHLPEAGAARSAVEVELGGERVGAILYDARLIGEPEAVRKAGRVVAIAFDRERLTADLLASEDALRRSRARVLEAADDERRRIAQDLHDGLQSRLVLLGIEADRIATGPRATREVRRDAATLRSGLDAAVSELRGLVQGVMPAALIERGLYAATEDLVDRLPIPARLVLAGGERPLPEGVERAAYFVVAEAIANALKHSGARELAVALTRPGTTLRIEVTDDGAGGAALVHGSGLRGAADRVDVLGGTFSVESRRGEGTTVVAEIPCAS